MKRKNEKVPGFDEIIFENRNKEYGAYRLRKIYKSTECISILGGAALFIAIIIGLTFTIDHKVIASNSSVVVIAKFDPIDPELNKLRKEEPPKPAVITEQNRYTPPVVVDDTVQITNTLAINDILNDSVKNRNVNDIISVTENPEQVIPVEKEPEVIVKEMPVFPGGEKALLSFISQNLKYPDEAIRNNLFGKVIIKFAVAADGSVRRIEVLRSINPLLDQEAVRVISMLPKWKPGKQNGVPVAVWYFVPVSFEIRNN
jgi:protein TonB